MYDQGGVPTTPIDAGTYTVTAVSASTNYVTGSPSATLTIAPAETQVVLSDLVQTWTGAPRPVTVTTVPADVPVLFTYDGSATVPSAPAATR